MRILQRYVLRDLLGPFLMSVCILTFLLLTTQLFRLTEYLINKGASLELLAKFLLALLPQILTLTLPMGMLVSVLLVFGRLSADREIMAIRTSGVNLFQLYWPVILLGGVGLTSVLFYFTNVAGPETRLNLTKLKSEVTYLLQGTLEPGLWHSPEAQGSDQVSIIFRDRLPDNTLEDVKMHMLTSEASHSSAKDQVFVTAKRAWITPLGDSQALELKLEAGAAHLFNQYDPDSYTLVRYNRLVRDLALAGDRVSRRGKNVDETITRELRWELGRLSIRSVADRARINQVQTELWQRFSMPFAAIAFVLLGMPLGVLGRTSGKAAGFGMAFGLIFVYYILLKWGTSLGHDGSPWAFWAIFSPNIILGMLGAVLMVRTIRA